MGKKVNPIALRLGTVFTWQSRWFAGKKEYKTVLKQDFQLRDQLMVKLAHAGIAKVEIERSINSIRIILYVAKPGMVIGRGGSGLEEVKKFITNIVSEQGKIATKDLPRIDTRVEAVKEPNLDAYLVAKNISDQLIKRLPFKRVLNQNAERVMGSGAKGVKILLSGRVGGAEIHRREKISLGTVPLSTIREEVRYATCPALTQKGYVGVKVWINLGEK